MYKTGNLSRWFQQRCSSLFVHQAMNSLNKPVNNTVQAVHVQTRQLNHVEACQQPCSNWPAQPYSSLSTGKNKLCVLRVIHEQKIMKLKAP